MVNMLNPEMMWTPGLAQDIPIKSLQDARDYLR